MGKKTVIVESLTEEELQTVAGIVGSNSAAASALIQGSKLTNPFYFRIGRTIHVLEEKEFKKMIKDAKEMVNEA